MFCRLSCIAELLLVVTADIRAAETMKPNIVLIVSDDQAWTDYGFMGHPVAATPNIDELASRGAVFTRGYVPTALCRPSLATIVTGLYPHQHGLTGNDPSTRLAPRTSRRYAELREELIALIDRHPTVPALLAEEGYLSFQSGKWWEGSYERGGFTHGMTRGFPAPGGRHGDDGLTIGRDGMAPIFRFVDQAVAEQNPFLVWYAPFLPHEPHNPPERLLAKYRQQVDSESVAKYYAMCEWFDETCGELVEYIDRKGLTHNTLFVYVGDNGWIQNPKGGGFLARSKRTAYEGGVRQPIMLCWPGVIEPQRRNELVSTIDLAPTILHAAGARVPENLPGHDLLAVVRDGEPLSREVIFGEAFTHDVAEIGRLESSLLCRWAIEGNWKLLLPFDGAVGRDASVHAQAPRGPELYDLANDPHETQNLAAENPKIVERLAAKIDAWWPMTAELRAGAGPEQ